MNRRTSNHFLGKWVQEAPQEWIRHLRDSYRVEEPFTKRILYSGKSLEDAKSVAEWWAQKNRKPIGVHHIRNGVVMGEVCRGEPVSVNPENRRLPPQQKP